MADQPTVLVVDDESHILHVVSLKLRNGGYNILTAQDGEEGLAVALEQQPDLIITDFQMPYMTGLELCIELKNHEKTESIPAIMLTARGSSLTQEHMDKTNIQAVISKPFSPRDVLTRVRETIGEGQLGADAA